VTPTVLEELPSDPDALEELLADPLDEETAS